MEYHISGNVKTIGGRVWKEMKKKEEIIEANTGVYKYKNF